MAQAAMNCRWRWRFWWWLRIIVAMVLVGELGLRIGFGLGNPPLLQADPDIGYLFQANQELSRFGRRVHINSFHQRSDDLGAVPEPNVFRVICVGDSVTWGGVLTDQKETYPELLGTELARKGTGVEVLNASAGSWGIGNELAYLKRFGVFGSDVLVLQIGSHDLLQVTSGPEKVGRHPSMPDRRPFGAISEVFWRYLWSRMVSSPPEISGRVSTATEAESTFLENMRDLVAAIALAQNVGCTVVVLHTPGRDEVVPGPAFQPASPYAPFRSRFLQVSASKSIAVVDLSQEWRGQSWVSSFYRDAAHLTPDGNAWVARRLSEAIATRQQPAVPTRISDP
jgi:lysophospholipase L1-like esterase